MSQKMQIILWYIHSVSRFATYINFYIPANIANMLKKEEIYVIKTLFFCIFYKIEETLLWDRMILWSNRKLKYTRPAQTAVL